MGQVDELVVPQGVLLVDIVDGHQLPRRNLHRDGIAEVVRYRELVQGDEVLVIPGLASHVNVCKPITLWRINYSQLFSLKEERASIC